MFLLAVLDLGTCAEEYKKETVSITIIEDETDASITEANENGIYRDADGDSADKLNIDIEKLDKSDLLIWYKNYKQIVSGREQYLEDNQKETIYDVFTEDEIYLIQRCVETETYQAPFINKVNVANVIFNRAYCLETDFGDTITDVITSPNQFAYFRKNISESTILAVEYAFKFEDTTDGALWFDSGSTNSAQKRKGYINTDEVGHNFYK